MPRSTAFYRGCVNVPEFDPDAYPPDHKYVKVADHIALRIEAGELPPGARITEPDLADEYGVHRLTIRQALQVLRERGLIRTLAGTGSFVLSPESEGEPGMSEGEPGMHSGENEDMEEH